MMVWCEVVYLERGQRNNFRERLQSQFDSVNAYIVPRSLYLLGLIAILANQVSQSCDFSPLKNKKSRVEPHFK